MYTTIPIGITGREGVGSLLIKLLVQLPGGASG